MLTQIQKSNTRPYQRECHTYKKANTTELPATGNPNARYLPKLSKMTHIPKLAKNATPAKINWNSTHGETKTSTTPAEANRNDTPVEGSTNAAPPETSIVSTPAETNRNRRKWPDNTHNDKKGMNTRGREILIDRAHCRTLYACLGFYVTLHSFFSQSFGLEKPLNVW